MESLTKHIKLVMKHKLEVFRRMKDCGYPIRGLFHDISKFSPTEFFESIKYYQGNRSPIEACKENKGYSDAWFHHRGRNKHHSQYWVDISFGKIEPCKMPWEYLVEHICDNVAAGRVYLGNSWTKHSPLEYYMEKDCKSFYHPETREAVLLAYEIIDKAGWYVLAEGIKMYGPEFLNYE